MKLVIAGPVNALTLRELITLTKATGHTRLADRAELLNVSASDAVRTTTSAVCERARADYAFVEDHLSLRAFKMIVFDMDSTLIQVECIDEIAAKVGLREEVSALTKAAMEGKQIDFKSSLRARVKLLKGVDISALRHVYEEQVCLSPGAAILLRRSKHLGIKVGILSGGFTYFSDRLRNDLELDFAHANELEIRDDRLTGMVTGTIVDGATKARLVRELMKRFDVSHDKLIVVGDGANDVPMMQLASFSVAYNAKPIVRAHAAHAIKFGGLDTIMHWLDDPTVE